MADEREKIEEQIKLLNELKEALTEVNGVELNLSGLNLEQGVNSGQQFLEIYQQIIDSTGESAVLDDQKNQKMQQQLNLLSRMAEVGVRAGVVDQKQLLTIQQKTLAAQKNLQILKQEEATAKSNLKNALGMKEEVHTIFKTNEEILRMKKLQLTAEDKAILKQQLYASVLTSVIDKATDLGAAMFDAAMGLESAARDLMKTSNFTFEEASRGIMQTAQATAVAGVGLEDITKSMTTLKSEFSGFTQLSSKSAQEVLNFSATMDKLGISASTTAKFFDVATKSLGMTTTETRNYLSSLKGFGQAAGVTMEQLNKNLAANIDQLSKYGKNGTQVFKQMTLASKQLGIEMNELFDITERFTTFEGAAGAAAKLNAVLGGDFINSVNLLSASLDDPIAVFEELKRGMDASGKSFNELDNGMKRVIADAAGLSVQQAGKLFSQDINTATAAMKEEAKTQEELNKIANQQLAIGDKLKTLYVALWPALQPFLDGLVVVAGWLTEVLTSFTAWMNESPNFVTGLQVLGTTIGIVVAALAFWGTVILPIRKFYTAMSALFKKTTAEKIADAAATETQAAATATKTAADAASVVPQEAAGKAAGGAAKGFLQLGAAIFLIGLGIGLIIGSIALLAFALKGMGSDGWILVGVLAAITVALIALGLAGPYIMPGLVLAGIGLAAIGAGLWMILAPIALVIASLSVLGIVVAIAAKALTPMFEAMARTAEAFVKIDDGVVGRFFALGAAFAGMADELERMQDTGVLEALLALSVFGVGPTLTATPAGAPVVPTKIAFSAGSVTETATEGTSTKIAGGGTEATPINITITNNSPIMLDNREIGRYVDTRTVAILGEARNA